MERGMNQKDEVHNHVVETTTEPFGNGLTHYRTVVTHSNAHVETYTSYSEGVAAYNHWSHVTRLQDSENNETPCC